MISSGKFCDAADTNEDIRNLIPCWIIYDTCLWQFKHFLEDFDRIGSLFTIDTVCIDLWNQRVSIGDRVKLFLHGGILHKKARSETERAFDHSDSIRNF